MSIVKFAGKKPEPKNSTPIVSKCEKCDLHHNPDVPIKKPAVMFDANHIYTTVGPIEVEGTPVQNAFFDITNEAYTFMKTIDSIYGNGTTSIIGNEAMHSMMESSILNLFFPFCACINSIFNTVESLISSDGDKRYGTLGDFAYINELRPVLINGIKQIMISPVNLDFDSLYQIIYPYIILEVNNYGVYAYSALRDKIIHDFNRASSNENVTTDDYQSILATFDTVFSRSMYSASYEAGAFASNLVTMIIEVNKMIKNTTNGSASSTAYIESLQDKFNTNAFNPNNAFRYEF